MDESVFRKKSIDRLTAPEQLNDHLKVITPRIWVVIGVIVLFVVGLFIWANFTAVESYVEGNATVKDGQMTVVFDDPIAEEYVEDGMVISIGKTETEINMCGFNEDKEFFAFADTDLPNGDYRARVGYDTVKVISMLFH